MIIVIQKIYIKVTKPCFRSFNFNFKNLIQRVIFKIKKVNIWIFVKAINDNNGFLGLIILKGVDSTWLSL